MPLLFSAAGRRPALAALALCAAFAALPAGALEKGSPAPAFELAGVNGPVLLSRQQGKLVYLDFWASWCAPCRQSFPWMNEMQARYGAQGLRVIAVNVDEKKEDALRFLQTSPVNFVVAFDPEGATPLSYRVMGMPTSLLIDAEGKVIAEHVGFKEGSRAELEEKIKLALGLKK